MLIIVQLTVVQWPIAALMLFINLHRLQLFRCFNKFSLITTQLAYLLKSIQS